MKKLITLLSIIALLTPIISFAGITSGLVEYWPLDTRDYSSATNILGRGGNADSGTLNSSPTKIIGKVGQALSFSGGNNVTFSGTSGTLNNPSTISVAFWMKTSTSATFMDMVNKIEDVGGGAGWAVGMVGTGLEFLWQDEGGADWYAKVATGFNASDGKWHYVVETFNYPNGIHVYIDNVDQSLTDEGSGTTVLNATSSVNIEIGNDQHLSGSNFPYTGLLDDVQLYSRVLSASEVTRLYRSEGGIHQNSFWGTLLADLGL